MGRVLDWIGARARWVMALGCVAALLLPGLASFLRPALPFLVCVVLAMAMARIDLAQVARDALSRRRLFEWLFLVALMMPATGAIAWLIGQFLHPNDAFALILFAAAPPIASSAGICFLMGYDARRAVEVTIFATILTPVIGPLMLDVFLDAPVALSSLDLALRLAGMIAGGITLALGIRATLGGERIGRLGRRFDGVAACVMVTFVFPLFDGVGPLVVEEPLRAVRVLVLSFVINLGLCIAIVMTGSRRIGRPAAGALGVMWGNRTVALYLAALPFDPTLALFVALYQFPMYLTPLILHALKLGHTDNMVDLRPQGGNVP
ncbi:hypothetical protein [Pontivivens insulae]|uniref:Pantothenates transporter PanS n=1 Tax=Pontivivens insulae TaxID=1639689 RepID=A0A2R8A8T3_9RHOB|nr:hypothetical protein [Pontivivens insulae]RED18562.1 putative Na+-dependent transporter [Pontivivens insulae]SPF28460.1 hypothetical protein POI8812_00761 [Pontivivens insulae]